MANNRIYLECTACEEPDLYFIAKRMASGFYQQHPVLDLDEWFEKHNHIDLDTQDHFRLVYENTRNYDIGTGIVGIIKGKVSPKPDVGE